MKCDKVLEVTWKLLLNGFHFMLVSIVWETFVRHQLKLIFIIASTIITAAPPPDPA